MCVSDRELEIDVSWSGGRTVSGSTCALAGWCDLRSRGLSVCVAGTADRHSFYRRWLGSLRRTADLGLRVGWPRLALVLGGDLHRAVAKEDGLISAERDGLETAKKAAGSSRSRPFLASGFRGLRANRRPRSMPRRSPMRAAPCRRARGARPGRRSRRYASSTVRPHPRAARLAARRASPIPRRD